MDKVVNEIRYQFVIRVRINQIKTPLPNGCVPNHLRRQILETLRDFIPSSVVHAYVPMVSGSHLPCLGYEYNLSQCQVRDLDVIDVPRALTRQSGGSDFAASNASASKRPQAQ